MISDWYEIASYSMRPGLDPIKEVYVYTFFVLYTYTCFSISMPSKHNNLKLYFLCRGFLHRGTRKHLEGKSWCLRTTSYQSLFICHIYKTVELLLIELFNSGRNSVFLVVNCHSEANIDQTSKSVSDVCTMFNWSFLHCCKKVFLS